MADHRLALAPLKPNFAGKLGGIREFARKVTSNTNLAKEPMNYPLADRRMVRGKT